MSPITISRAEAGDSARLAPLFDSYRGFYELAADLEGAERFLRERLERKDSIVLYATAQESRAILGFVQLYPCFSSLRMQPTLILNDLYVHQDARRRGIARSLLQGAYALACERGAVFLHLETAKTNRAARGLYESEGYELDRKYEHYNLEV